MNTKLAIALLILFNAVSLIYALIRYIRLAINNKSLIVGFDDMVDSEIFTFTFLWLFIFPNAVAIFTFLTLQIYKLI